MTAVLAGVPNAKSIDDTEALLPWQLIPEQATKPITANRVLREKFHPERYRIGTDRMDRLPCTGVPFA